MTVIALVGNKGGAGKTTLATNIATSMACRANTAILDADPQGSSHQWRAIREGGDDSRAPIVYEATEEIEAKVSELQQQFSYIVIDCPPSVHAPQTHAALSVSDIALIPVQPSPLDLWATVHIERAIEEAYKINPRLRARLVINQLEPRTILSGLVREALDEIDLPVADTAVRRRAIYRTSVLEGKSVFNMGSRGSEAADELDKLISEVIP